MPEENDLSHFSDDEINDFYDEHFDDENPSSDVMRMLREHTNRLNR